jgi:hypothetical protein
MEFWENRYKILEKLFVGKYIWKMGIEHRYKILEKLFVGK